MIVSPWLTEWGMVPCRCGAAYKRTSGPWACGVACVESERAGRVAVGSTGSARGGRLAGASASPAGSTPAQRPTRIGRGSPMDGKSGVAPRCAVTESPAHRKGKAAEDAMCAQLQAEGYECVRELRFAPPRRWRFDVAVPSRMVAVEVDGGAFTGGHSRGTAYERECEKYAKAAAMGWRVVRCTPRMVKDGRALALVRAVMEGK